MSLSLLLLFFAVIMSVLSRGLVLSCLVFIVVTVSSVVVFVWGGNCGGGYGDDVCKGTCIGTPCFDICIPSPCGHRHVN